MINSAQDVRTLRDEIGIEGFRNAAIDANRKPPAPRTIRRWVADNRIPHEDVAENIRRRALVKSQGGVESFAAKLGLSKSSIYRYQHGVTDQFRSAGHRKSEVRAQTDRTLTRAGVADSTGGTLKSPKITVEASFEYRNNGKSSVEHRQSGRNFELSDLTAENARDFTDAIARQDHAGAIAVVERHLTEDYATSFGEFDDHTGFHITHVSEFGVDWE